MRLTAVLLLAGLLAGCGDPIVMIPGGRLSGEEREPPAQWARVPDTIQVEMRPEDPYSINIWGVGIGANLYIATGADGTRWSGFLARDPRVRVRMGESLYALTAVEVTDSAERQAVAAAYVNKYDVEVDDNWVAEGLVFRLER